MEIRKYSKADDVMLYDMMREEGPDWECYYGDDAAERYREALNSSISYVAYEGDMLCGYVRCRDDSGLGLYVYDLLVKKNCRGRDIGRKLIERACSDYPDETVYVLSGADGYYEKMGYEREGSVYKIR